MKLHRSRKVGLMVPTASMGDIAFLLTIFFILTSNFVKEGGLVLTPPRALEVEKMKEPRISVAIDEEGKIFLQGKQVPDAEAIEWGVAALIKNRQTEEGRTVMFRCDSNIQRAQFEPVLEAIATAGALIAAVGDPQTEQ